MGVRLPPGVVEFAILPGALRRTGERQLTTGENVGTILVTTGDLAYGIGLLVATVLLIDALRTRDVALTDSIAIAALPWAVIAASLSVLTRNIDLPETVSPMLSSPVAYLTVFVLTGCCCLVVPTPEEVENSSPTVPKLLEWCGLLLITPIVAVTLAIDGQKLHLVWPAIGLVVSAAMTGILWSYLAARSPVTTTRTGVLGIAVLFGHLLDANTTLIGIDVLGFREQTPLPQSILELASTLPIADSLGVGWLFFLIKLVVAIAIVRILAVAVDTHHRPVLLGVTAVAGLGPGVHNLVLYVVL
jgi:uncharacterized membrane protein